MSNYFDFDPELADALERDPELMRIAGMLGSAKQPEPPLDDAFRASLRRQLMDQAWDSVEDRRAWWRGWLAPQRMAWAGAAAVFVLAASIVFYTAAQPGGSITQTIQVATTLDQNQSVSTHQAIPLRFNQPMDHASTEAAVQIVPATAVTFSWSGDQLLYVTPSSGDLAPNTQYQVTVGAGARTQAGTHNANPQTFTFVTSQGAGAAPTPTPVPTPSAPASALSNVRQLTTSYPPAGGAAQPVIWSASSSMIFFIGAGGAVEAISVADGSSRTLVQSGASLLAFSPTGDRIAYVRGSTIVTTGLVGGPGREMPVDATPTALMWVQGRLYWASASGVFHTGEGGGPVKVADLPAPGATFISIAPDGAHAVAQDGDGLDIVDLSSGKSTSLCTGGCGTSFQGWSPDGTRVVYNGTIADTNGNAVSSLHGAQEISWSTADEILLGSDTGLFESRPDGSSYTKLADGAFRSPVWAPNSTTFAFVRGSSLWVADAPAPSAPLPALDDAVNVVREFMQARLGGEALRLRAMSFLDANGKAAYSGSSPALIPQGSPALKRYYIVMSEVDPSTGSVRVVVRLVFARAKVELQAIDETLTLTRNQPTDPYLIDGATAGPVLEFGKGPQVVAVKVTAGQVSVTFDSDLVATSITNVTLQDDQGAAVHATATYSDRTVIFTGLQLTPGAHYRLVVLPGVQDVGNHNAAGEYDLDFIGPGADATAGASGPTPAATPSARATQTPGGQS